MVAAGLMTLAAPPSLRDLLTAYAEGRYEESVSSAAAVEDLGPIRLQFVQEVPGWIGSEPEVAERKRAFAAAFLLELAHARLESDWRRLIDLVEWTCVQLRAGVDPEFERSWYRASVALASRARERTWLLGDYPLLPRQRPPGRIPPVKNPSPAHLMHALDRFPDDAHLRLARIVAWTWGRDAEPLRNAGDVPAVSPRRRATVVDAISELRALGGDPEVGAEARMRIGQLQLSMADHAAALASFELAQSSDAPVIRYLAHFLAGRTLEALSRPDAARHQYEEALRVVPDAESAAVALASLQFVQDDRAAAVARFEKAFASPVKQDDPGRLVGYGNFVHWPELRDQMRARLRR
jgi:tetratricopeptide (TPR) repeat protein